MNIGTIGDPQCGKTTLLRAVCHYMNFTNTNTATSDFVEDNDSKLSLSDSNANFVNIEYESDTRHYLQADTPSKRELIPNVINGCSQVESLLCVVDCGNGIGPILKELMRCVKLTHDCGDYFEGSGAVPLLETPRVILFLNKSDEMDGGNTDEELVSLVEMEALEFVESLRIRQPPTVIRGSALAALSHLETLRKSRSNRGLLGTEEETEVLAPIRELVDAFESTPLTSPMVAKNASANSNSSSKPTLQTQDFIMPIQTVYNLTGVGIAAIGKVLCGEMCTQDTVEIVGLAKKPSTASGKKQQPKAKKGSSAASSQLSLKASVASLKLFMKPLKTGLPRDYLGVALHGDDISNKTVKRGMFVYKKTADSLTHFVHCFEFFADMHLWSAENGGRKTPVSSGYRPVFYFLTSEIVGTIDLSECLDSEVKAQNMWATGRSLQRCKVVLSESCLLWKGLPFVFRDAGNTIGHGHIVDAVPVIS